MERKKQTCDHQIASECQTVGLNLEIALSRLYLELNEVHKHS